LVRKRLRKFSGAIHADDDKEKNGEKQEGLDRKSGAGAGTGELAKGCYRGIYEFFVNG